MRPPGKRGSWGEGVCVCLTAGLFALSLPEEGQGGSVLAPRQPVMLGTSSMTEEGSRKAGQRLLLLYVQYFIQSPCGFACGMLLGLGSRVAGRMLPVAWQTRPAKRCCAPCCALLRHCKKHIQVQILHSKCAYIQGFNSSLKDALGAARLQQI